MTEPYGESTQDLTEKPKQDVGGDFGCLTAILMGVVGIFVIMFMYCQVN